MSYDFYVDFRIQSKEDIDKLTSGSGRYSEVQNPLTKIILLNTVFGVKENTTNSNEELKAYAKVGERGHTAGLKAIIHSCGQYNNVLLCSLSEMNLHGIDLSVDISLLPQGSWVLEFPVTLSKPFISKDDVSLYIIENPVLKDKVFGVPFTSAMAWKGNLRWTMMKLFLETKVNEPEEFAKIRFWHTLLFGTEKGMEEVEKGWAKYLGELCEEAKEIYADKLKQAFNSNELPSLIGMLHFYPTFWDRIDMEVINPHDRKTKTGKSPIYHEVVPAGAKGVFRLLYVPFYYLNRPSGELKSEVLKDLGDVAHGLKELMLTYGFSAKKSSGYGVIENNWDKASSQLIIKGVSDVIKFSNFEELEQGIKKFQEKIL